jgi:hypothetical protein
VIWKDNRIQTNQASLVHPGNKVASSKIARNRNVNANSVSAKNKVANSAVAVVNRAVAANKVANSAVAVVKRAVAANKVASKEDDKPGYLEKKAAGGDSRRFFRYSTRIKRYRFAASVVIRLCKVR